MNRVTRLARDRIDKDPLRASIALTKRMEAIQIGQQVRGFAREFGPRLRPEQLGAMQSVKDPLRFVFQ